MADTTDTTLKKLEKILLKNGRAACPNPACKKSIISEEKKGRAGTTILEYWCENETCAYHKRRVIPISISKGILEQVQGGFSVLSKRAITGIIGLFLVIGATLGNYVPKWLGMNEEENKQVEQVLQDNKDLRQQLKALIADRSDSIPASYNTSGQGADNAIKNQRIEELEQEVKDLKAMMAVLPLCESDLKNMVKEAEKLMKTDDLTNAKKIFERIYTDLRVKNAFLLPENNDLKRRMVERMADSYSTILNKFTYEYFKEANSFRFFQDFLDTFPVPAKEIYMGKAFYNYPNYIDEKLSQTDSKRYQLQAVQHYLVAARDGRFTASDTYIISAINNVLELYQLFKYKSGGAPLPANYVTIETAIANKNVAIIKKRIDELQSIIDRLTPAG